MQPRHILVINVSRIGDTLLATPAIRALATAWPDARIDVLGHPNRVEVLEHLPFVGRVSAISKKSAPFRGWAGLLSKPYDLAVVYGHDEALVAYALRVARRVAAFRQRNEMLNQKVNVLVEPQPLFGDHAVRLALALPAALGIKPAGERLAYFVAANELAWARQTLAHDLPSHTSPRIGLQVASFPTKAYRDWPIESFVELCERIRAHWPKAHFLIFGGAAEHERTEALKTRLDTAATLYAGKISLRQTGALMSQLHLYIGVDTGPTHLMSALDIPLVGLYHGYSRSELIGPLDHPCFYPVDHPLAGTECTMEATMADITVNRVWESVRQALSEHPPG